VKTLVDNLARPPFAGCFAREVAITGGIGVLPRGVQLRIPDPAERARVMPETPAIGGDLAAALPIGRALQRST